MFIMVDVDIFNNLEPIDITPLLKEIDLPVRLVNILKKETFYSVESFYKTVEDLRLKYMSSYLFPNSYVSFYPQVKERHATTNLTCCLSGSIIRKGSLYCSYSPFIENLKGGGYTLFLNGFMWKVVTLIIYHRIWELMKNGVID